MNRILLTSLILIFSLNSSLGQSIIGARLTSMGNNNAAVNDTWNFTGNFNRNTRISNPTIAVGYAKYFYENELSNQSFKFVLPNKKYEFGLSFLRYGITEYNEITAGTSLAKNFGNKFSLGLRVNYHQLKIQNYGSTIGFSVDAGIMYHFNSELTVGFNLINPSKQTYHNSSVAIKIPSTLNIGLAYKPSNKILVATTLSKNFNEKYDVGLGIDYQFLGILSLRGGITVKPFKQYGGLGLEYRRFKLDFSIANDPYLGYSSQIGMAYAF